MPYVFQIFSQLLELREPGEFSAVGLRRSRCATASGCCLSFLDSISLVSRVIHQLGRFDVCLESVDDGARQRVISSGVGAQ